MKYRLPTISYNEGPEFYLRKPIFQNFEISIVSSTTYTCKVGFLLCCNFNVIRGVAVLTLNDSVSESNITNIFTDWKLTSDRSHELIKDSIKYPWIDPKS